MYKSKQYINGIEYSVHYSKDSGYIEVMDANGIIASGQMDDSFESFCFEYENPMDCDFEASGCSSDMYNWHNQDETGEYIATWLVNTHPCN